MINCIKNKNLGKIAQVIKNYLFIDRKLNIIFYKFCKQYSERTSADLFLEFENIH